MATQTKLQQQIADFFRSRPSGCDFPTGGIIEIPLPSEQALLEAIEQSAPLGEAELLPFRKNLTIRDTYSLLIFAVRMAILAARTGAPGIFRAGLLGVVVDDEVADWRDVLTALSIIEDCASRIGLDFRSELEKALELATEGRRKTIHEGYLSRSPEMRTTRIMGFVPSGEGKSLRYVHR